MSDWISWTETPPQRFGEWAVIEWIVCHDGPPEEFTGEPEVLIVRKQFHTLKHTHGMYWRPVLGYPDDHGVYSLGFRDLT